MAGKCPSVVNTDGWGPIVSSVSTVGLGTGYHAGTMLASHPAAWVWRWREATVQGETT